MEKASSNLCDHPTFYFSADGVHTRVAGLPSRKREAGGSQGSSVEIQRNQG